MSFEVLISVFTFIASNYNLVAYIIVAYPIFNYFLKPNFHHKNYCYLMCSLLSLIFTKMILNTVLSFTEILNHTNIPADKCVPEYVIAILDRIRGTLNNTLRFVEFLIGFESLLHIRYFRIYNDYSSKLLYGLVCAISVSLSFGLGIMTHHYNLSPIIFSCFFTGIEGVTLMMHGILYLKRIELIREGKLACGVFAGLDQKFNMIKDAKTIKFNWDLIKWILLVQVSSSIIFPFIFYGFTGLCYQVAWNVICLVRNSVTLYAVFVAGISMDPKKVIFLFDNCIKRDYVERDKNETKDLETQSFAIHEPPKEDIWAIMVI